MRRKLLVIDDEPNVRAVTRLSLEVMGGWEAIEAASGPEGVRLASEAQPDAVLLDVMMPGMDGPATVLALRANADTAAIPVILLTAKVQPADRARFHALGVAGLIAKPFDPAALPGEIARLLSWEAP